VPALNGPSSVATLVWWASAIVGSSLNATRTSWSAHRKGTTGMPGVVESCLHICKPVSMLHHSESLISQHTTSHKLQPFGKMKFIYKKNSCQVYLNQENPLPLSFLSANLHLCPMCQGSYSIIHACYIKFALQFTISRQLIKAQMLSSLLLFCKCSGLLTCILLQQACPAY